MDTRGLKEEDQPVVKTIIISNLNLAIKNYWRSIIIQYARGKNIDLYIARELSFFFFPVIIGRRLTDLI